MSSKQRKLPREAFAVQEPCRDIYLVSSLNPRIRACFCLFPFHIRFTRIGAIPIAIFYMGSHLDTRYRESSYELHETSECST